MGQDTMEIYKDGKLVTKRPIPTHIYQGGGVTPINAPLLDLGQSIPLVAQVSTQQLDPGTRAFTQFEALSIERQNQRSLERARKIDMELQRRRLDLAERELGFAEEKFDWEKETWKQEYDFRERAMDLETNLQLTKLFSLSSESNPSTGVSKEESLMTGLSANTQTPGQAAIAVEYQKKLLDMKMQMAESLVSEDPSQFASSMGKYQKQVLQESTTPMMREMHKQIIDHSDQMYKYQENPTQYDPEVYEHNFKKYRNSQNVLESYKLLQPSIENMAKSFFEQNQKNFTELQGVQIPTGGAPLVQVIKKNPDMRQAFENYINENYDAALREKYKVKQEKGAIDPTVAPQRDYETWKKDYIRTITTSYGTPGFETVGGPQEVKAAAPVVSTPGSTSGHHWTPAAPFEISNDPKERSPIEKSYDVGSSGYFLDTESKFEIPSPIDLGMGRSSDGKKPYMSHQLGMTNAELTGGGTGQGGWGNAVITPEAEEGVRTAAKTMFSNMNFSDEALWDPKTKVLTRQGREAVDQYQKLWKQSALGTPIIHNYEDNTKEKAQDRAQVTFNSINPASPVLNLTDGKVVKAEDIHKLINSDKVSVQHIGFFDDQNMVAMYARTGGAGREGEEYKFGANADVIKVVDNSGKEPKISFYSVPKPESWQQSNPQALHNNKIYVRAGQGLGHTIPVDEQTFDGWMESNGWAPDKPVGTEGSAFSAYDNLTGIRLPKIEATGNTKQVAFSAGVEFLLDKSDEYATAKVVAEDISSASDGVRIVHEAQKALGSDHHIHAQQIQNRQKNGVPVWAIKIDDGEVGYYPADQLGTGLAEQVDNARGAVNVEAGNYWPNMGTPQPGVNLNLNRRFVQDWATYMDPLFVDNPYNISSGYRPGDPGGHGKRIKVDAADSPGMIKVLRSLNYNIEKSPIDKDGKELIKYYDLPGTPFEVAWHLNRGETNNWHFDFKYK